jgi:hypothetical protein
VNHHFSSGHSDATPEVSPPDTAGKLGGASFLLSGAAAFSLTAKPADNPLFGVRQRRISERLPAVFAGSKRIGRPSKAVICRTISETSAASEPPPLGSQAPVSASSPVLIGANPFMSAVHDLGDVRVHLPASHFANDSERAESNGTERKDRNRNHLNVKHRIHLLVLWCGVNT